MRVTLVLTHLCNLACDYCYTGEKFNRAMPDRIAWAALAWGLPRAFRDGHLTLAFFGGEPLLEWALLARITRLTEAWARRRKIAVEFQLTTNVTLLNPSILHFLRHHGFRVGLSVDGTGHDHDRHRPYRGGQRSSQVVWENLTLAAGKLAANIHLVLNPDSLDGLAHSVERLHQLGYQEFTLLPNLEAHWTEAARHKARQAYRQLRELQQRNPGLSVSPLELAQAPLRNCGFGIADVAVSPGGNFYPCARLVGTDRRQPLQIGHVGSGLDLERVARLRAQSQQQRDAQGGQPGCACATWISQDPGRHMEQEGFFRELATASLS